jgi:hypothetical protein
VLQWFILPGKTDRHTELTGSKKTVIWALKEVSSGEESGKEITFQEAEGPGEPAPCSCSRGPKRTSALAYPKLFFNRAPSTFHLFITKDITGANGRIM